MRVMTWNLEWARRREARGWFSRRFEEIQADVMCLTELPVAMMPEVEKRLLGGPDWGYPIQPSRRKVALWSRDGWERVDLDAGEIPGGRLVAGKSFGITFVGVCIPWRDAHVRTGRRDRAIWEDHLSFLAGLERALLPLRALGEPVCVLGDFNQQIPRKYSPVRVFSALETCLGLGSEDGLSVATAGVTASDGRAMIDHIAVGGGITVTDVSVLERYGHEDRLMSDHAGVVCQIGNL